MNRLIPVDNPKEIPEKYRGTPFDSLFQYQNMDKAFETYANAQLLIGMCMDYRKHLHIPENYAFIIRSGGANLRYSEFKISYALAVAELRHIALIGHTNCGMVNIIARKQQIIHGLVDIAGWDKSDAEDHFNHFAPMFEIGNEVDFILSEAKRLRLRYPKIQVAPLLYKVEDNRLYALRED
jgi:carbonic anhydrase